MLRCCVGMRHMRSWCYRQRVERQALRYYLRGEGLRPTVAQMAALGAIWRGEA